MMRRRRHDEATGGEPVASGKTTQPANPTTTIIMHRRHRRVPADAPAVEASVWQVQIVDPVTGKPVPFNTHDSRERADAEAARLRTHKFFAQVRRVAPTREEVQR